MLLLNEDLDNLVTDYHHNGNTICTTSRNYSM